MADRKQNKLLNIIKLHLCILLYVCVSLLSKIAAQFPFLSMAYILLICGMFVVLGLYALLWQQAIKPFPPSVAYSNKSITIIWTTIISALFFSEKITMNNILGIPVIIAGIVLVVSNDE